ncbi:hypothetical protein VQ045_12470 [Aurantimonas sp. E1-2-R+4]|uniref:hypothetical protein n=1 Tax=Aurantimonas sp. E1-2-R+4 TaxID=3113714 RepID=UPI002F94B48E
MYDRRAIMQAAWARYNKGKSRFFNRQWFRAALIWAWKEAKDRAGIVAIRAAQDALAERVRAELTAERAAGIFHEPTAADIREMMISATPFRMSASRQRAELAIAA